MDSRVKPAEEVSEQTVMIDSVEKRNNLQAQSTRPRVWWSYILLPLSVLTPLGVLIWWIVNTAENRPAMLSARTIGGQLTYIQAKAIDFVCGATLAPLLMIVLDYLWFSNARVVVVNERPNSKPVPLASLVAVSQSSAGSFNVVKMWTLLQGKTWRLGFLSLLILLSGLAGSMLQNFIAYEAFNVDVPDGQPVSLRSLRNNYIDSSQFFSYTGGADGLLESLPTAQKSDMANQISALLTGLNYESAISNLDHGAAYIGTNATKASLNALDSSIVGLTNVPGYRLSVDCQPGSPTYLTALQMGETFFQFTLIFNCLTKANASCGANYYALFPGIMGIQNKYANNDEYQYIGFLSNNTYAYLAYLDSFNYTSTVLPSEYGPVHGQVYNMTSSGFTSTKALMTNWGITCGIRRQEGFLNYTRQANGSSWEIAAASFSEDQTLVPSFLAAWQTALNYQAPISAIPGIGPAVGATAGGAASKTANWTIYALNYLYASGEAQRISYEVAAQNSTAGSNTTAAGFFYDVSATRSVQSYRITYIPLILLLGLLGVIGAACIAGALTFYSKDTLSGRQGREVNGVRLVIDGVVGLQDSVAMKEAARIVSITELDDWAKGYRVRYSATMEKDGDVGIGLFHSGGNVVDE